MTGRYLLVAIIVLMISYSVQSAETTQKHDGEKKYYLYGFDVNYLEMQGGCRTVSLNIGQCEVNVMDKFCRTLGFSGSFYGELKLKGVNDADLEKNPHLRTGFVYRHDETFHIICKYDS